MFLSLAVYIGAMLLAAGSAVLAQRKENRRYLWIGAAVLTLVAGLRGSGVGIDTDRYIYLFRMIEWGLPEYAYGLEESFKWICGIILSICNHPNVIFLLLALVTYSCVLMRLWDFRALISIPCAVICYCCAYFFLSMNIARQMCAVAIIFFATRYLAKRSYIKFIVLVLAAALFHKTAMIAALFLCAEVLLWKYLSDRQKRILKPMIFAAPVAIIAALIVFRRSLHYFLEPHFNFGLMILAKLVFLALSRNQLTCREEGPGLNGGRRRLDWKRLVPAKLLPRVQGLVRVICPEPGEAPQAAPEAAGQGYQVAAIQLYYFMGLLLSAVGYIYPNMERLGLCFAMFECVYFGMLLKHSRYKRPVAVCVAALIAYEFILSLITNSNGQLPYLFFWQ